MAPLSLPAIPGAVSQAMDAGESHGVGLAVLGSWGSPRGWARPQLPGLGRPVCQERQHFWERYHARFPPAASLDRLVCQPFPAGAPCRAVPRRAVPCHARLL